MTTRLDRLLLLLDTGSTPVIRRTAAQQLGEVQKLHPHELNNLLKRVHVHLKSSNWDTRIAAGEAIEAITSNVPKWEPTGLVVKSERENVTTEGSSDSKHDILVFEKFDITHVLKHGEALLGSSGQEYDIFDEELLGLDVKERLARQQELLRRRLGMVPGVESGMDILLDDDDILPAHVVVKKTLEKQKSKEGQSTADLVAAEIAAISSSADMSSREKNRAKRRAKVLAKQRSKDNNSPVGVPSKEEKEGPPEKKIKHTSQVVVDQPEDPDKILIDSVRDTTSWIEEEVEWPFTTFCQELCHELFHPSWEVRHGAATGLRHIVRIHGTGAGRRTDMRNDEMSSANELWLEDMSLKLLCVFALDRFGDFVTDEVVAPVRETCAQTLGVVVKHMKPIAVKSILNILLTLQAQQEWQVRHGGLLGIKYLLAVRKDMTDQLLPVVLAPLIGGLEDCDDDVRAVSATAMLPVVNQMLSMSDQIPAILWILWESLTLLDDLSASTSSILMLLAAIVSSSGVQSEEAITGKHGVSLSCVVPRLWPFLRHNILSVRKATLQTLKIILATYRKRLDQASSEQTCWLSPIIEHATRHFFERFLVEQDKELLMLLQEVWTSTIECVQGRQVAMVTSQWINIWLSMAMYPKSAAFNPAWIISAPVQHKDGSNNSVTPDHIGGIVVGKTPAEVESVILQSRYASSRALGFLGYYLSSIGDDACLAALDMFVQCLHGALMSTSGSQYIIAAMTVSEWASLDESCKHLSSLVPKLTHVLTAQVVYDEVGVLFTRLQTDCQSLLIAFQEKAVDTSSVTQSGYHTIESATLLVSTVFEEAVKNLSAKNVGVLESKRRHLVATIGQLQYEFEKHNIRVLSMIAGALVTMKSLPPKLNPIIRPLMDAIKKEEDPAMQQHAARNLTKLLEFCLDRSSCPNSKIVKNLCSFACNDPSETPIVAASPKTSSAVTESQSTNGNMVDSRYSGIITLAKQNESKSLNSSSRKESSKLAAAGDVPSSVVKDTQKDEENQKNVKLQRNGAELTLRNIARHFQENLPEKIPELWNIMIDTLERILQNVPDLQALQDNDSSAQEIVNSLQLLELLAPTLNKVLQEKVLGLISSILRCLEHPYSSVRHMTARVLGTLSTLFTLRVMEIVLDKVVPLLNAVDNIGAREGAIETLYYVTNRLHVNVIPYVVLLIIPTLGAMSDHSDQVRLLGAQCFATLISLMPLESSAKPMQLSAVLNEKRDEERLFLKQLFGETKLDNFVVPVPIKAELRKYQQDGVNWLSFLRKYKLHGILCDDMGLGKTLQTICIVAGDYHEKLTASKEEGNVMPSLVICPPTLTGHWCYEVEKFIAKEHLNPLHYTGPPAERQRLRHKVKKHNLVVASYDIVRNDSDFFKSISWNYCVLDEGHIIKNAKTKMSKVIKELRASHRLILSGTPIQNNVLELWSLFDFLMPGFLGSEKKFQTQYGKPILMSRDAKSSSKEQEEGALAMEGLHRQVLPFLLRRMKEDVLQDLPPKIIQDYYCELSPLQLELYEDFAKTKAKIDMENSFNTTEDGERKEKKKGPPHVFQALQYLRKVCNHPALVLTPSHPEYERITAKLKLQCTSLHDINNSSKLVALRQLLQDCGIGVSQSTDGVPSDPIVSQHRVLLFCQFKSMLDIIEQDLLQRHMPTVSFLRLDGSTPAGQRHSLVQRFNDDPSIDMLLLTTHVGGLGLNLTGADTVIFVEHDWNPMKDAQAMDRAHRIGQKKVVNVYRLIARGTLEEKIMGLQKFKLNIANTVITQENSSFASMDTSQVLDLFTVENRKDKKSAATSNKPSSNKTTMSDVIENLGELWEQEQYEVEYDLNSFMNKLTS